MEVLQLAIQQGADVDKLAKLLELQERWEAGQARKAFTAAMTRFKQNPPRIGKNKHVKMVFKDGRGSAEYDHATLDHVTAQVTKALSAVGISHKWEVEQQNGISVTCVLTHELGHSERTTLSAGADTSGSKNAIQAIGSTVTYLQRYTLLAATGLAASDQDDDGKTSDHRAAMPEESVVDWLNAIASAADLDDLKTQYFDAAKKAETFHDTAAVAKFQKAKNERYRQLKGGSL
jgi:hypothetical protein